MNKWLVVHSLESFSQNPRMIGFAAKTKLDGSPSFDENGKPIPAIAKFSEMKPEDRVVYYCKGDLVIKGIYEISQCHYAKETQWPNSPIQFEIKPIIELEEPYDFKLLLSSLDLFKQLTDLRYWGMNLQGVNNSIKFLTDHDYELIEKSITTVQKDIQKEKEEAKEELPDYRQHLLLQYQIANWGLNNHYRVHIAVNDKNAIREQLPEVLDEIPKFHREDIVDIAKRIDVLFFHKERDILTHAFEVEHTTTIYSGLLRLNDIAESYPSETVKFFIVSKQENSGKFDKEIVRPSFFLLKKRNCEFRDYEQVTEAWRELKKKKPPIF